MRIWNNHQIRVIQTKRHVDMPVFRLLNLWNSLATVHATCIDCIEAAAAQRIKRLCSPGNPPTDCTNVSNEKAVKRTVESVILPLRNGHSPHPQVHWTRPCSPQAWKPVRVLCLPTSTLVSFTLIKDFGKTYWPLVSLCFTNEIIKWPSSCGLETIIVVCVLLECIIQCKSWNFAYAWLDQSYSQQNIYAYVCIQRLTLRSRKEAENFRVHRNNLPIKPRRHFLVRALAPTNPIW